jgi:small-conductance mechanosensitive channel
VSTAGNGGGAVPHGRPDTAAEQLISAYIRTLRAEAACRQSRAARAEAAPGGAAATEDDCGRLREQALRLQSEREALLARLETETPPGGAAGRKEPDDWLVRLRQFHGCAAGYPALWQSDPALAEALLTALGERATAHFPLPADELLPIVAEAVLLETAREIFFRLDAELRQTLASASGTPPSGELIKAQLSRRRQLLSRLLMEAA